MKPKLPKKRIKTLVKYWDKEYQEKKDFALSENPASDLVHFADWFDKQKDEFPPEKKAFFLDAGCGNGRNLIYACQRYQAIGFGFDSSKKAIELAEKLAKERKVLKNQTHFSVGDFESKGLASIINYKSSKENAISFIEETTGQREKKFYFIIDFMSSHYIVDETKRKIYFATLKDILDRDGFIIIKSFLKDGDLHAKKLLKKYGSESTNNVYTHPNIKEEEFIWSEHYFFEIVSEAGLEVAKFLRSHKHIIKGKIGKRRTFTAYLRHPRNKILE